METNILENQDSIIVDVEGRVDTTNARDLEGVVLPLVDKTNNLALDFKNLEYISSAGLRVLLAIQKSMNAKNGSFKLMNINEFVKEVLEMTGFDSIITVEYSE